MERWNGRRSEDFISENTEVCQRPAEFLIAGFRRSILRHSVLPAIKLALDACVVETTHRIRCKKCRHRITVNLAVVIELAIQGYQHVRIALVVAHSIDETASRDVCVVKVLQIDFTAVFDEGALCAP
jgi:hypothetical protein